MRANQGTTITTPTFSTAWEDARVDAFFLEVGRNTDSVVLNGIAQGVQGGVHARVGWVIDNSEGGGSASFLRAVWLDELRAIITWGVKDGNGFSEHWKASFTADGQVLETQWLGRVRNSKPVPLDVARHLWYSGADELPDLIPPPTNEPLRTGI